MIKVLQAGFLAGLAINCVMFVTFRLIGFGWKGGGLLLDPELQSGKLIEVWSVIEPLPLVVTSPERIVLGLFVFGVIHAYFYDRFAEVWPRGVTPRAWRFAVLVFMMTYLFWEFFTPYNLFSEPFALIAVELVFWAAIALAEGYAIAAVFELARSPFEY